MGGPFKRGWGLLLQGLGLTLGRFRADFKNHIAVSANWRSFLKFRAELRNHIAVSINWRSF